MSIKKITILGDIMCEPRLLKAARIPNGQYDFSCVFQHVRTLFEESDFVIGNLETPLAGEEAGYVNSLFRFNAPDSLALAGQAAGIRLFLTANNHCLDRGLTGLKRTVETLDHQQIMHTGTYSGTEEKRNAYFKLGNTRFAVISYTYGTNFSDNHIVLSEEEKEHINLLRPQTESYYIHHRQRHALRERVFNKIANSFHGEKRFYARKVLGLPINQAHADDNLKLDTLSPYLQKLFYDIDEAKNTADVVLFCPHIGGQFNKTPGDFSRYIFSAASERGVDAIVASHTHVVQKVEWKGNTPCFYSLGNFSMSPNSIYLLHENLPEYGIAAHLYYDDNTLTKASFTILRIVEKESLTIFPVDDYYRICSNEERDQVLTAVRQIYSTVTGSVLANGTVAHEYVL